ncbi:MAG: tetratricopeptide repeat protein [Firmicutes bacterium]|nr:tetratricopeptide repeat protein [Bacillota bacterium]
MKFLNLGEKIRKLRKEKGLTLEELAGDIATKSYISLIENNKSVPRLDVLKHIANMLEVELEYLVKDENTEAKEYCDLKIKELKTNLEYKEYKIVETLITELEEIIEKYDLKLQRGKLLSVKGFYLIKKEILEEALLNLHKGNRIYLEEGYDKEAIIENYHYIGYIYTKQKQFKSALDKYKVCEQMIDSEDILDTELKRKIYFNISICYYELGLYEKSLDYISYVTNIMEDNNNLELGRNIMHKGNTYIKLNQYKKAEKCFKNSLKIAKKAKDSKYEAYIENNLGRVYLTNGDEEKGLYHLNNAYTLKKLYGYSNINTLLEYVMYYINKEDFNKAVKYLKEAEKNNKKDENLYKIYNHYCEVYVNLKENDKAKEYIKKSINILENMERPAELSKAFEKYANILELENKLSESIEYLKLSIKLKDKEKI